MNHIFVVVAKLRYTNESCGPKCGNPSDRRHTCDTRRSATASANVGLRVQSSRQLGQPATHGHQQGSFVVDSTREARAMQHKHGQVSREPEQLAVGGRARPPRRGRSSAATSDHRGQAQVPLHDQSEELRGREPVRQRRHCRSTTAHGRKRPVAADVALLLGRSPHAQLHVEQGAAAGERRARIEPTGLGALDRSALRVRHAATPVGSPTTTTTTNAC